MTPIIERPEFPLEAQRRAVKATKIARVLRKTRCASCVARDLDDEGWANAAKAAGTRPASPLTRLVVIALLEADES